MRRITAPSPSSSFLQMGKLRLRKGKGFVHVTQES
jgi:hypothetical protein